MPDTFHSLTPLLEVFDLPTSIAFYRDVLDFTLISGDDSWWCMLKLGGATLMLNTAYDDGERPSAPDRSRVWGHADTCLYLAVDSPENIYAQLQQKGWPATGPAIISYGMKQVSTRGPDGASKSFHRSAQAAWLIALTTTRN